MKYSKFNLDIPKIGYFLVYKKGDNKFLTNMIVQEQINEGFSPEDAEYTHVEISGGGQWSVGATFPKSRLIDIAKEHKGRYVKIVKYKASDYEIKRYKVAFFGATRCNLSYGFFGMLWFKINHLFFKKKNILASKNAPWCSFLASQALIDVYGGICFGGTASRATMPAHFLNKKEFETVWEGYIPNDNQ